MSKTALTPKSDPYPEPPPNHNHVQYPTAAAVSAWTDTYFKRTKDIIGRFGDQTVTYAVFMRRPVVSAPRLAVEWLYNIARERGAQIQIDINYAEGRWVGAGEPILYVSGSFYHLVDLETILLMKLGSACVAAYNAYAMCADLPKVAFLAMDARHCAGTEMAELMAYAASVGSTRAKRKVGALGFVGNANDATAHYFGQRYGLGTMPHALIGYAGSTVRAAEMFYEAFPNLNLTALVDYFGHEVTDSVAVARRFPDLAASGQLGVRLDTAGSRFVEGLDPSASYAILERLAHDAIRGYRDETELRYLVGPGVSAAAIFHVREALNQAGFPNVRIVASSGFNPAKCRLMAEAGAPINMIGTGSYLPDRWTETYATADVIDYNGARKVKIGREFLFRKTSGLSKAQSEGNG